MLWKQIYHEAECECVSREEAEAALAEAEKRISERNAEVRALHGELAEALADKERYMKLAQMLQKRLEERGR